MQQVMPAASEIYFQLEETETINFFSPLQTILMRENKAVCFRDGMFLSEENIRLQDFILHKLWKTGKRIWVPDVLTICVNSHSCISDQLICETLFPRSRAACWIKALSWWKTNIAFHNWSSISLLFFFLWLFSPLLKAQIIVGAYVDCNISRWFWEEINTFCHRLLWVLPVFPRAVDQSLWGVWKY